MHRGGRGDASGKPQVRLSGGIGMYREGIGGRLWEAAWRLRETSGMPRGGLLEASGRARAGCVEASGRPQGSFMRPREGFEDVICMEMLKIDSKALVLN